MKHPVYLSSKHTVSLIEVRTLNEDDFVLVEAPAAADPRGAGPPVVLGADLLGSITIESLWVESCR